MIEYTEAQATDEALRLFVRKTRRFGEDVFARVMGELSAGARDAIVLAENRADALREDGVARRFVTIGERVDRELGTEA